MTVSKEAVVNEPLTLEAWIADDNVVSPGTRIQKAPVSVTWSLFRGPGPVKFAEPKPEVEKTEGARPPKANFLGKATTLVSFRDPGEYLLQITANDASGEGGGGFQCCWTTAFVRVAVKAEPTTGQ